MKTSIKIKNGLSDIAAIVAREFRIISTSYAILLVLIGGIFIYGFLYNYMYEPNLIRNAPVAVVDRSHSALSRQYTRLIDAAPQVSVYTTEPDFPGAKELLKKGEVIGIIYIPDDFETRVNRGGEAVFIMYGTTDAFLYYLAMQEASAGIVPRCWFFCRSRTSSRLRRPKPYPSWAPPCTITPKDTAVT